MGGGVEVKRSSVDVVAVGGGRERQLQLQLQCGGGGVVRARVVLAAYQDHQIIEHLDLEYNVKVVSSNCVWSR